MGQDSFGEKGDDYVTPLRSCPVNVHDLHLFCLYSLFKSNQIISHPSSISRRSCHAHPFMTPHHVDSPKGYEILKFVLWLLCCYEGLLSMCCSLVLALLIIYLFSFLLIGLNRCSLSGQLWCPKGCLHSIFSLNHDGGVESISLAKLYVTLHLCLTCGLESPTKSCDNQRRHEFLLNLSRSSTLNPLRT